MWPGSGWTLASGYGLHSSASPSSVYQPSLSHFAASDSWAAKALGIKKLGAGASRREAHPGAVWLPEEGGEGAEFSALPFLSFAQEGWTLLWRDEI